MRRISYRPCTTAGATLAAALWQPVGQTRLCSTGRSEKSNEKGAEGEKDGVEDIGTDEATARFAPHPPIAEAQVIPRPSTLLKAIEKEIDDEEYRLDKEAPKMPEDWTVEHKEGTSYFTMTREWTAEVVGQPCKELHRIRVQLTTRDPALDPEFDLRGEHFPFILHIERPEQNEIMQLVCDIVEGEILVDHFHIIDSSVAELGGGITEAEKAENIESDVVAAKRALIFPGPNLEETEDDVLDATMSWLAERQIDDQLGEFIGQYSTWVEQLEYERWLRDFKFFVEEETRAAMQPL